MDIGPYLDLGYSGIVPLDQSADQETVVCRDRHKRCLRLTAKRSSADGRTQLDIKRVEMIGEMRYRKAVDEHGGVLDDEKYLRARSQRRMARIAAQHELAQLAPICPLCGHKMEPAPAGDRWRCVAQPPCPGSRPAAPEVLQRYADLARSLARSG